MVVMGVLDKTVGHVKIAMTCESLVDPAGRSSAANNENVSLLCRVSIASLKYHLVGDSATIAFIIIY